MQEYFLEYWMSILKKIRFAGQKEVFLQKEQRNSEPWNPELLVPVSARKKGKKFLYLKRTFFLQKMLSFQSWEKAIALTHKGSHITENLTIGTVLSVNI